MDKAAESLGRRVVIAAAQGAVAVLIASAAKKVVATVADHLDVTINFHK